MQPRPAQGDVDLTGRLAMAGAQVKITDGKLGVIDGPFVETKEYLGGLTIVDVPDEEAARMWAGKIATACGWPQEVRRFKPQGQP